MIVCTYFINFIFNSILVCDGHTVALPMRCTTADKCCMQFGFIVKWKAIACVWSVCCEPLVPYVRSISGCDHAAVCGLYLLPRLGRLLKVSGLCVRVCIPVSEGGSIVQATTAANCYKTFMAFFSFYFCEKGSCRLFFSLLCCAGGKTIEWHWALAFRSLNILWPVFEEEGRAIGL